MPTQTLIGHSGFVGTTLKRQAAFQQLYRSTDIDGIRGAELDTVVCCAAPALKWKANREPEADRLNLDRLMEHLATIRCKTFVLISTVDVFKNPVGADEATPVDEEGLHPYGLHRRRLEKWVEGRFARSLVVRLPGLVGPGLRKNVIFDFLNANNLQAIDSRGVFQFYPMVNLWYDIQIALQAGLERVHLTAEPVEVAEISEACFGKPFHQILSAPPAVYDFQTNHAALFGGHGRYQYSRRETLQAIRAYAQSEPLAPKAESGAAR